MWTM